MKKAILIFLSLILILSCIGCAAEALPVRTEPTQTETASTPEETLEGGWNIPTDPQITPELQSLVDRAFEGLTGVSYSPVALLATQVVAGTNYRMLLRALPVLPDAVEVYAIGTIYQDLDGNVTLEDVQTTDVPTDLNDMPGGWAQADSAQVSSEARAAFDAAVEGLVGVDYQPVALAATQVAAGTNYAIVCQATVVYPDAEPYYAIVYVSADWGVHSHFLDVVGLVKHEKGWCAALRGSPTQPVLSGFSCRFIQRFTVSTNRRKAFLPSGVFL